MAFLKTLGVPAAARAPATERAIGGVHAIGMVDNPYKINWNIDRAVKDGLERSIWVYRAINTIASVCAARDVVIRRGGKGLDSPVLGKDVGSTGKVLSIPSDAMGLLTALNKRANDFETGLQFRYRLMAQLLIAKQGVFIEVLRRRNGSVGALYLLPPGQVHPIPHPDTFVSGYRVETVRGEITDLPPEKVLWIRVPHPTDPYSSQTPMEAAGLSIDTDFYAKLFNRSFLANDGSKRAVISVKGDLLPDDAEELKRRWGTGPAHAGGVSVIEADGISVVEPGGNHRDAQYVESQSLTKNDILGAFGLSETFIGTAAGSTYANAEAEEEIAWRVGIMPLLRIVDQALDSLWGDGTMDDDYLVHDLSDVSVLHRDSIRKGERAQVEWDKGLITADEYRAVVGRDPLDKPGSNVVWVPATGKVAVGEAEAEAAKLPVMGAAAAGGEAPGGVPGPGGPGANGKAPPDRREKRDADKLPTRT